MVELWCFLVGAAGSAFPVRVDASNWVHYLKEAIKAENPRTITCDTDELKLYLAKKGDDTWLGSSTDDVEKLKKGEKTALIEALTHEDNELDAQFGLEEVLEGMPQPEEEQIHVLVVVPETKRRRMTGIFHGVMETPPPTEKVDPVMPPTVHNVNYVTLLAALLAKCGLLAPTPDKVMLYCRREVHDLWDFVEEHVIEQNAKVFIVGPAGTGKSLSTLSYVTQLDPNQWNVVWIHFGAWRDSCLSMGTREYWENIDLSTFVAPRVAGKRLLVCLDGYTADSDQLRFLRGILCDLTENDRCLVCSAMSTLGNLNEEDAELEKIRVFNMCSWTLADYEAAVADDAFYEQIMAKLDATTASGVNDDSAEEEASEAEKKKDALDRKFYYAGGSCRFMFQRTTDHVKQRLQIAVGNATNDIDLINYFCVNRHEDMIDKLYGMASGERGRFPVSSHAASLLTNESRAETIVLLASRLDSSTNAAANGHLLKWLFLASVPRLAVKLVGDGGAVDELPRAYVLEFDPKKRFQVWPNGWMMGNKSWLQPVPWNQAGYDAVYFDKDKGNVIFIQVARSDTYSFKMRFFNEVLLKLEAANVAIKSVEIYVVVKSAQCLKLTVGRIDDRDLLSRWTQPEETHVKVRAFKTIRLQQ